jgi:protein Tex
MESIIINKIATAINVKPFQIKNVFELFEEGSTIPFVARYRKERTGSLDEVQLMDIKTQLEYYDKLEKRKETICKTLQEIGTLTPELEKQFRETYDSVVLEDLYLPYKPKKKTRASEAKAKGLEPIAKLIFEQKNILLQQEVLQVSKSKNLTAEEVLSGARDIIAEWISENISVRNELRKEFANSAIISTKVSKSKQADAQKYENYFAFSEPLKKSPSHRILAMMRGENESFLSLSIAIVEDTACKIINKVVLKGYNDSANQVKIAAEDSFKRLLSPSIEKEFYNEVKHRADVEAIRVFAENLRQLLLLPPLGQKRILGIDPGFRSGCKIVCLNEYGDLLHNETIYPHAPQNETSKAMNKISQLVQTYKIEAIAIGNGTASRETENFITRIRFSQDIQVFVVNEAGASVYSASKVAREEFPQYDVTVRGAVSIGRRLMDPLAELVKIEPKSIGVGQYQHDVDQTDLQKSLDFVVESCVNLVGVELNTASKHLLAYVSGIGPVLAENIVNYRKENGAFESRKDIMKVPKMGKKSFEQCAGFLRIQNAKNPLDNSAVHPERYDVVSKMAKDLQATISDLLQNEQLRNRIEISKYVNDEVGLPTLQDILKELEKPGRDPRKKIKSFAFDERLKVLTDVEIGAKYPGVVTNITNFGAFVDIGIKQNGLVHISQICKEYITNPADVLSINQYVMVKVLEVDEARNRLQLSIKEAE